MAREAQTFVVRNVSSRRLVAASSRRRRRRLGGAARSASKPRGFVLRIGRSRDVGDRARPAAPRDRGADRCDRGRRRREPQTLRIPWAIAFPPYREPTAARALNRAVFAPSDFDPARAHVRAGGVVADRRRPDRPGRAARLLLYTRRRQVRRLARAAARPAARRVQFGITGRGPSGAQLAARHGTSAPRRLAGARRRAKPSRARVAFRIEWIRRDGHGAARVAPAREPFELAQQQLQEVADTFGIDDDLVEVLGAVQEVGRGLDPDVDGRRHRARLHGLARHAQHRARPVEGRHPLPPGRHARRGQGARDVDDVEVRADGPAVRRRQGRRDVRSEGAVARRARAHDAPLHLRDRQRDRPGARHPRTRRRHERRR